MPPKKSGKIQKNSQENPNDQNPKLHNEPPIQPEPMTTNQTYLPDTTFQTNGPTQQPNISDNSFMRIYENNPDQNDIIVNNQILSNLHTASQPIYDHQTPNVNLQRHSTVQTTLKLEPTNLNNAHPGLQKNPTVSSMSTNSSALSDADPDNLIEKYLLSGRKALKTVVFLSIGPLLSQVSYAICGIVQTVWITKKMGKDGMTAISSYQPFVNIARAFGLTIATSGSNAVSSFVGRGNTSDEGGQVICDLLRVSFIIGILIPAILCPTVQMAVKWFGASQYIVQLGWKYIFPILLCTFTTCVYLSFSGFVEGEGKTLYYAIITVSSSLFNMFVLSPIFIFVCNLGLLGAGLANVISELIPAIVLLALYFTGYFAMKPKFIQLKNKFSPLTTSALKASLSQGIANLGLSVPAIIIRKLIGKSGITIENYNNQIAAFHLMNRYCMLTNTVNMGFNSGYLPPASYAYCSQNYKRWLLLTFHVNWLTFAWSSLSAILTWSIPGEIARMFSSDEGYLYWAKPMLRNANALGFLVFARYSVGTMLKSLGCGIEAAILGTIVHLLAIIGFSLMLYYTDKQNTLRIMYAYPLSYAFGFVLVVACMIPHIVRIYRLWKEQEKDKTEMNQAYSQNKLPSLLLLEGANLIEVE